MPVNLGKIGWEREAKAVDGDQSFRSFVQRLVTTKGQVITCHPAWLDSLPPHSRFVLGRVIRSGRHFVVKDVNMPEGQAHVHEPEK